MHSRLLAAALVFVSSATGCGRIGYGAGTSGPCAAPDGDALAIYPFDDDGGRTVVRDVAGGHEGTASRTLAVTDGPAGCGDAAVFGGAYEVIVSDSPDWDLDVGSVDVWVRLDALPDGEAAILSRDADGNQLPGHFTILVDGGARPYVRIQDAEGTPSGAVALLCAEEPLSLGRWVHLGVNIGPPAGELYVGGALQSGTGSVVFGTTTYDCGLVSDAGIAGNDNPWAIGGGTVQSAEGHADLIDRRLTGAVDHVRISSARRDFAAPPP